MSESFENKNWHFGSKNWVLLVIGFSLLVFSFWGGLQELFVRWDKQEEYSHGYILPLLTIYFIWQKKHEIQQEEFRPSWSGLFVVVGALIIAFVGEISALYLLIHYAFIAVIIGAALALMGWRVLKLVLLPLLLLVFAIPLPYFFEAQLTANLQLLSSKLGVYVIRWCQIPAYLEGNLIDLGVYKLQVVEACSGLRYLFPLMSLGFICAYMYSADFWKKLVLFFSTIPITILMNSFRIGMIGILVDNWGSAMAEGFVHDFEGWIVFMACLGVLILEMMLLHRIGNDNRSFSEVFGFQVIEYQAASSSQQNRDISKPFCVIIVCIILAGFSVRMLDRREEILPARKAFVDFPVQLSGWVGQHDKLSVNEINALKFTDYVMVNYVNDGDKQVNFYSAYYASQRKGESPHSPSVCMPGGGWQIAELDRVSRDGQPFNRIVLKKGELKQLVYYWFQQRGRMIANEYWMKWYLFEDAIRLNRTDGALVRLTTVIYPDESEADADARLSQIFKQLMPILPEYLPN